MAITKKDVKYVSTLSRIEMNEKELEAFTRELDKILEYMNKLNELNTDNVKPTAHILDVKNVKREDKLTDESLSNDEALQMAPEKERGFFKVPKVIE